jgi:Secretion system C-terminal sorting domain
MKILFSSIFLVCTICIAQQNNFNIEYEMQKFVERGGNLEELSPNVYKLTYRTGESRTFNLNHLDIESGANENIDTTIINVWEIDTTKFNSIFKFWHQVEVSNISWWLPQPVEDLNDNGRLELYGITNTIIPNQGGPVKIFERNLNGIYQNVFTYVTATVLVKGIADINGDGDKEIFLGTTEVYHTYPVFKSDSSGNLPTTFDFFFYLDTLQINGMTFGDWDYNGVSDCALITGSVWELPLCIIAEYRDSLNNFEECFRFQSTEGNISGFAIGDFDLDKKTEFVFSSVQGNVFVIETKNENEYSIVNQFSFPAYNAYMHIATKDIDGNGKPEFWIGGQNFVDGITVFQCYEEDGDNSYKPVARIELRYLTSLYNQYIQAVDIDDDGKEELIISIGNVILIIKFAGSPNNQQYKLWYAKLGEATQPGAQFYPVCIADLDGDGKKDLLIPMEKGTPSIIYNFSYILRKDEPSRITESAIPDMSLEFIKGYPNPFNSESTISFNIIETSNVQIKIYNSLGKEINVLLDKELSSGKYEIFWDVKDKFGNSLPSGVYLIVLKTKNSVKTFKSILLK